jgi:hypothetical protein
MRCATELQKNVFGSPLGEIFVGPHGEYGPSLVRSLKERLEEMHEMPIAR